MCVAPLCSCLQKTGCRPSSEDTRVLSSCPHRGPPPFLFFLLFHLGDTTFDLNSYSALPRRLSLAHKRGNLRLFTCFHVGVEECRSLNQSVNKDNSFSSMGFVTASLEDRFIHSAAILI